MKRVVYFVAVMTFLVALFASYQLLQARPAEKVLICHVPPGNADNSHFIEISPNAIPAHRAHGDCDVGGFDSISVGTPCDCIDDGFAWLERF